MAEVPVAAKEEASVVVMEVVLVVAKEEELFFTRNFQKKSERKCNRIKKISNSSRIIRGKRVNL